MVDTTANPAPLGLFGFGMTTVLLNLHNAGFFWLTLVGLIALPQLGIGEVPGDAAMAAYLAAWGGFTALLFVGTLRLNRALQFVFASLTVLFFLLAAVRITGNATLGVLTGWEGIVCGMSAIYAGIAQVLNELHGREVLPLGAMA